MGPGGEVWNGIAMLEDLRSNLSVSKSCRKHSNAIS